MKRLFIPTLAIASLLFLTACEWESGGDFNTSSGAQITNISGFYRGSVGSNGIAREGARAVDRTSSGTITSLTIQQSGNVVEVRDSQGSVYRGSVAPPVTSSFLNGVIPAGSQISSFQVSFQGKDGVASRDVTFTGVISLTAVQAIEGSVNTVLRGNGSDTNGTVDPTTGETSSNGADAPVTAIDPVTGEVITITETRGNDTDSSRVAVLVYTLGEATTQFRLRGTWIESGGIASEVDAVSSGAAGVIEFVAPNIEIDSNIEGSDVSAGDNDTIDINL